MIQRIVVLMIMLWLHIFADYHLQGILAQMKQFSWWTKHVKSDYDKYKDDYIQALLAHSFEWAFIVSLPLLYFLWKGGFEAAPGAVYLTQLLGNTFVHSVIDDKKANRGELNLMQDQRCHVYQIVATWAIWMFMMEVK